MRHSSGAEWKGAERVSAGARGCDGESGEETTGHTVTHDDTDNESSELVPLEKELEHRMVEEYMSYKVRETKKERDELRKESIFIQMGMNRQPRNSGP